MTVYTISQLIFSFFCTLQYRKILFLKVKAFILSLCLLVYMTELVALPVAINTSPSKGICCAGKMSRMEHHPCKKPQRDCNMPNCSLDCPLCYVMTMPVETLSQKLVSGLKKDYPAFQPGYIFQYSATVWKPPNA